MRQLDNTLAKWINYIHLTVGYQQYRHVDDGISIVKLGLLHDVSFAGVLDSTSALGGLLCMSGKRTFFSNFLDVRKANRSFTPDHRGRINSPDAGLRNDGWLAACVIIFEQPTDILPLRRSQSFIPVTMFRTTSFLPKAARHGF